MLNRPIRVFLKCMKRRSVLRSTSALFRGIGTAGGFTGPDGYRWVLQDASGPANVSSCGNVKAWIVGWPASFEGGKAKRQSTKEGRTASSYPLFVDEQRRVWRREGRSSSAEAVPAYVQKFHDGVAAYLQKDAAKHPALLPIRPPIRPPINRTEKLLKTG